MSGVVAGFGERLKELREARGLSQSSLAEKAGTHPDSVWKFERSMRNPSLGIATRLARALGVTLNDLVPEFAQASAKTGS